MPMPQRKPKPQQQFPSNNTNSLLVLGAGGVGSGGSGSSTTNFNNNGRRSPYYATNPCYHHPHQHPHPHHHHPSSHYRGGGGAGSGYHHHHSMLSLGPPPPPPPPLPPPPTQPPLITDTLTACLDVNGTYVCTSYSPRCYIIQKVTPTSVTVTPTQQILTGPPPAPPPPPGFGGFGLHHHHRPGPDPFFGGFPQRSPSKYTPFHQQQLQHGGHYHHHHHAHHSHSHSHQTGSVNASTSTCTHHSQSPQTNPGQAQSKLQSKSDALDSTSTTSAKTTTTSSLSTSHKHASNYRAISSIGKDSLLQIAPKASADTGQITSTSAPIAITISKTVDTGTETETEVGTQAKVESETLVPVPEAESDLSVGVVEVSEERLSQNSETSCNKEDRDQDHPASGAATETENGTDNIDTKEEDRVDPDTDKGMNSGKSERDKVSKNACVPEVEEKPQDTPKNAEDLTRKEPDFSHMNGEVDSSLPHAEEVQIVPQCAGDPAVTSDTRLLNGDVSNGSKVPQEKMALNNVGEKSVAVEVGKGQSQSSSHNNDQAIAMNGDEHISSDTPIDELRQLLLTQLEYYFSPENLSNDKFLVSQMDSDQYVYISTVANFNMIKKLSSDLDLITDVLKESKQVQVHSDGKRIRPVSNRTVVILRGIPESTPIEEIKALFEKENSPKCNNCEFAFNDSWYLSFDNDDEAVRAHRYLREDIREFKGHPIMARIKSRPTTLLAQGVGVNPTVKNGYNPPPQPPIPSYMNVPYVSQSTQGNQPGPTAVAAPIFTGQQMTPTVFTIPTGPYASFGAQVPWTGYYDINSAAIFSLNGLQQPQSQPSPNYNNKGIQMASRNRNTKSETDNYYRMTRPPRRNEGSSSTGGSFPTHQYGGGGNQHRKSSGPQPLLGMPPLPLNSHHTPSHSHNHSHHGHIVGSGNSANMNRNSVHYNNSSLSSHNVPHNMSDSYHYSNNSRYRGNENRPRSSLGTRKPPRSYEDDSNYESHNHNHSSTSTTTTVSNRGNPSTRQTPSTPVSPQPPPSQRVSSPQNQQGKTNFDLESNAFPPLPGAVNSSVKNGDSAYEGRLSDVVKGVKNVKLNHNGDREDVGTNTAPSEIVVSAQDNSRESTYVVSAASPTKELDSPKELSSQSNSCEHKKEFREVGVGSADDSRSSVRVVPYKEPAAAVAKNKETADKSTRTDTALLHGDHSTSGNRQPDKPPGAKGSTVESHPHGGNDNYRKSVPQSTKSPIVSKRGVPGSQQHAPLTSTVAVGSEVPYSHKDTASSPIKHNFTSGHVDGGNGRERPGSASYVAKIQGDNNSRASTSVNLATHRSNFNTSDNDAFPAPGSIKSNVPTNKAANSWGVDHSSKEVGPVGRTDEKAKDSDKKKCGDENICSNEDPVRLSYAQILAQSRKDKVSQNSNAQLPQASSSSSSTVSQAGSGTISNAQAEDKKKSLTDSKDSRPLSKANFQRGNSNGSDSSDRGRGGYRRFRTRISSENSEGGVGGSNFSRPPRRNRSPIQDKR